MRGASVDGSRAAARARWTRAGALAVAAVLLGAATSEAGIIVLDTGDTIVGRIDPKDVYPDKVVARWPHGDLREKGQLDVQRRRIRWMDEQADAPTDGYWEAHLDAPIDERWAAARAEFIRRRRAAAQPPTGELEIPVEPIAPDLLGGKVECPDYELRKPLEWTATPGGEKGITMIVAPPGTRARIHVFAVDSPGADRAEQLEWIKATLARMADAPDAPFEVDELYKLKPVPGGVDQLMVTTTRRGDRVVRALRKVMFRDGRTVLFAAYADDRDYPEVEETFHRVLSTLRFKVAP